jgi:hypothetical protein
MPDKESKYCGLTLGILSKTFVLPNITTCGNLNANRRFGDTYRLHIQVRSISRIINHYKKGFKQTFHHTALCNIPEDTTLRRNRDEDQKSTYFIRLNESNQVE